MKKFTFALMALLAFSFSLKAQQFVSTLPANRNVILEEFTGRNCTWCPSGHVIANQIMANNPGKAWAINVHAGGFSPTTFPNLNTSDGTAICSGFGVSSFPSGVVNRSTSSGVDRNQWAGQSNTQLSQAAECNVGGMVVLNPATRVATITVEVYYTGNSSADENFLTVAMLQDSILGSQTGMGDNPAQVIGSQYCHMHVLRDIINTSTWGDTISPTTQGTLITRTYTYEVPQTIGNPNGVEVKLDNIFFLAWVSERKQGTPTRPILNGCELDMVYGANEPFYPMIYNISPVGTTCSHTKDVEIGIQNIGTEPLTSLKLDVEMDGVTQTISWEGEMPVFGTDRVEVTLEVPFGNPPINVFITEANGEPFSSQTTSNIECLEWADLESEAEEEDLKLVIMQDKYGAQTTWEVSVSNGTVIASGGPYQTLAGGTATQPHMEMVTVPVNECVKFTIKDSAGNGICCSNGQGYFLIKDSHNNILAGDENNGDFGSSASLLVSVKNPNAVQVTVGETSVDLFDDINAYFIAPLDYEGYPDEVGFIYHKVTNSDQITVVGHLNEFRKILATVTDLEPSSIYMVKAYAVINGVPYYGPEATFQTGTVGINEFEQSLKLYPNPTSNVLNVEGEDMNSIEVYNAVGQRVMAQEVNGNKAQVSTESLNNGVYFIRVLTGGGEVITRKVTIIQ